MSGETAAGGRRGGPKVRGTCGAGHVTETNAAKGRVTWHGECAHAECDLKVLCKRVPATRAAEEPAPDPETPPTSGPTVKEVDYATPPPKRKRADADGAEPAGGPGAEPRPDRDDAPDEPALPGAEPPPGRHTDSPAVGESVREPDPPRARRRLRFSSPLDG